MNIRSLMHIIETKLFCSDGSVSQSQDDSIVGTRQCRHSLAIMPIPGTLSSSSPDLLQPTTSILDFSNPSGKTAAFAWFTGWLQDSCFRGGNYIFYQHQTCWVRLPVYLVALTGPNWRFAEKPNCLNLSCLLFCNVTLELVFTKKCILPPLRVLNLLDFTRTLVGADYPCLHLSLLSCLPNSSTPGDLTCPSTIFEYI